MINRKYLIRKLLEHTNENCITNACKKFALECSIDWHVIYNFTKSTIPKEENLIRILETLQVDCNVLFL